MTEGDMGTPSRFDDEDIEDIKKIEPMLDSDEVVKVVARQSKTAPGGKIVSPKTIFVTDRRVLIRDPSLLGLRSEVDSIPFSQINNIKLEKGVFSTKVKIASSYFIKEKEGFIDAIPKDRAEKISAAINEGIKESQFKNPEPQQKLDDNPLTLLKKRLAKGEISKEEFEELRKLIE